MRFRAREDTSAHVADGNLRLRCSIVNVAKINPGCLDVKSFTAALCTRFTSVTKCPYLLRVANMEKRLEPVHGHRIYLKHQNCYL